MSLPSLPSSCLCVVVEMALLDTTGFSSCRGESAGFSALVDWVTNPADLWIVSDSGMEWINQDYFKEFIASVAVDPV